MVENRGNPASDFAIDRLFHALASAPRRAMLRQLASRDCTVGELAAPFDMSIAAVSKHVEVLAGAGLVEKRHSGRNTLCHLNAASLTEASRVLDYYQEFWNRRLDNLEGFLEQPQS